MRNEAAVNPQATTVLQKGPLKVSTSVNIGVDGKTRVRVVNVNSPFFKGVI